jgi:hypothetical protein
MRSNPTPEITEETETRRCGRDEGGFVLPWLALMLIVLVAMAGFGVDVWNWWYSAQKMQRAADAGALAGVTLMPDLTAAGAKAHDLVVQNGYSSSTAVQGAKTNQLVVTVDDTVNNYFTSLLGLSTTKLKRSATAEFNAPVSMGAPRGYAHLANDPEKGSTDQHWLNIGAPAVDKQTGDRFADKTNCGGGAYACNGVTNTEYIDGTYIYTVDVETVPADIQVYDPAYANGEQNCTNEWLSTDQITALELQRDPLKDPIPAGTRYAGGGPPPSPYCTGDDSTNLNKPQATDPAARWAGSARAGASARISSTATPRTATTIGSTS